MMMLKTLAVVAFAISGTNGAIVKLYHDRNCQQEAGERNVWDNTCAPTGAWSSFKIVYDGAWGQIIRGHHTNNCWDGSTGACTEAVASDQCFDCNKGDTSCNSLGSYNWRC